MSEPLLVARHLEMNFGGVVAVHNVGFDLEDGEFICIIGSNGVEKMTLICMLIGLLKPSKGTMELDGKVVPWLQAHRR